MEGKLYWINTVPYIVIVADETLKAMTRRAYRIDKARRTAEARVNGKLTTVCFHY